MRDEPFDKMVCQFGLLGQLPADGFRFRDILTHSAKFIFLFISIHMLSFHLLAGSWAS